MVQRASFRTCNAKCLHERPSDWDLRLGLAPVPFLQHFTLSCSLSLSGRVLYCLQVASTGHGTSTYLAWTAHIPLQPDISTKHLHCNSPTATNVGRGPRYLTLARSSAGTFRSNKEQW
eukprot:5967499-Amphidinium_carterae.2